MTQDIHGNIIQPYQRSNRPFINGGLVVKYNSLEQHKKTIRSTAKITWTNGTRQLTVNTCLVNAYDVLKPPCMAATVAYSNPMRRRPIVVVYKVWTTYTRPRLLIVRWGVHTSTHRERLQCEVGNTGGDVR